MSKPNPTAEREEAIYKVYCPECDDDMFEGTPSEIEAWAKKNGHDQYLDWTDIEEGCCHTLCNQCSWIISNM